MKIKLWGTRGSIPVPGPATVKYGGNTSCIELRFGEKDRLVVIDAGTGIRLLGNDVVKKDLARGPVKADIFLTHTHWDHILGFPFFTPIFIKGTELNLYGPVTYEEVSLEKVIGDQLQYRYFPVKQSDLAAQINYITLSEGRLDLGDGMQLQTKYLNHPCLCLGYRFEFGGKTFCTVYDHEPFTNLFPTDPADPGYDAVMADEGEIVAREENERVQDFYRGADLLIHDCQYTREEYLSSKVGWGHSTFEYAVESAQEAEVKKLVLAHHDPMRTDAQLDELAEYCQSLKEGSAMEVVIAREGQEFAL